MSAATAVIVAALLAAQDGAKPAAPAAPAAAPVAATPKVAATFYAWYDHPGAHFTDAAGHDLQRDHFVDPERVHADSPEWFAGELADAAAAGLDLLLFVTTGTGNDAAAPGAPWFEALAGGFERTRGRLERPVGAALLVEPWCLALQRGGAFDLGDAAQREATLAMILAFQRALRPEDWGRLGDAPLVVFGRVAGGGDGARGGAATAEFFAELRKRYRAAFGVEPAIVLDRTWIRDPSAAPSDRTWREGAAILGPQRGSIASLGPGYDDRQVGNPLGAVRPREGGRVYASAWQQLLDEPHELVVVESWNQLHDGTAIAPTLEHGRRYVELTRRYADLLRSGGHVAAGDRIVPRFDAAVGAADFADDRRFSTCDDVAFRPGDDEGGIVVLPGSDARLAFVETSGSEVLHVSARAGEGAARLRFDVSDAFPAATPEPYEATVRYASAGEAAHVELVGAGADDAEAGATRQAHFTVASLPKRGANGNVDFELRVRGGPIVLEVIALRRTRHRLAGEGGEAAPFRRVVLDWSELEPKAGALDEARLRERLGVGGDPSKRANDAAARDVALVVLQSPPDWALPTGAHPDEVAAIVHHVVAAMAEDPALRLLELFPRANRDGVLGKSADVQGYVRVLRAAATAAHDAAPNVALSLGAIDGPDVPWLREIQGLKQPFAYDAATFEWDVESGTPGDATCAREFERMLARWRAGGDGGKPFFVVRNSAIDRAEPFGNGLMSKEIAAVPKDLALLIRFACRRLGREPGPISVLDEEALPLVRGVPSARVVAELESAGFKASAIATPALEQALDGGTGSVVVLAQGELFPESLAPKIAPFVDRGGLLVTCGGAPFRRPAQRWLDGGFTLRDESAVGMELRDSLRIEVAPLAPGDFSSGVPETAAELRSGIDVDFGYAVTFTRRAGRPRDSRGVHRFEPLIEVARNGAVVGAAAALLTYSAERKGAVLLFGADGGGRIVEDGTEASIVEATRTLAKECGALASFGASIRIGAPRK